MGDWRIEEPSVFESRPTASPAEVTSSTSVETRVCASTFESIPSPTKADVSNCSKLDELHFDEPSVFESCPKARRSNVTCATSLQVIDEPSVFESRPKARRSNVTCATSLPVIDEPSVFESCPKARTLLRSRQSVQLSRASLPGVGPTCGCRCRPRTAESLAVNPASSKAFPRRVLQLPSAMNKRRCRPLISSRSRTFQESPPQQSLGGLLLLQVRMRPLVNPCLRACRKPLPHTPNQVLFAVVAIRSTPRTMMSEEACQNRGRSPSILSGKRELFAVILAQGQLQSALQGNGEHQATTLHATRGHCTCQAHTLKCAGK